MGITRFLAYSGIQWATVLPETLLPHTEVEFVVEDDQVILRRKQNSSGFRKIRGIVKGKFTTDEIMALTRK